MAYLTVRYPTAFLGFDGDTPFVYDVSLIDWDATEARFAADFQAALEKAFPGVETTFIGDGHNTDPMAIDTDLPDRNAAEDKVIKIHRRFRSVQTWIVLQDGTPASFPKWSDVYPGQMRI